MLEHLNSYRKRTDFLLLLFLFPLGLMAQQSLNLDFEKPSVEGMQRPWGWALTSWGNSIFSMDSTKVHQGRYSLHSRCLGIGSCEKQSLGFDMEPYEMRGKTIAVEGFVKGQDLKKAVSISLVYSRVEEATGAYIDELIEVKSQDLSNTFDWTPVAVSISIPESVVLAKFWINQEGEGEAWFDDFRLSIAGEVVPELQIGQAFSQKNIDWLVQQAVPFHSPLPTSLEHKFPKEELSFFKNAVGDSKIIGLGESTHGTSEFFSLKHKLLQYAVNELGFRVFALEDHLLMAQNINEYVKTGKGTLAESMAGCFGVWQRQEVVDMIQWIRRYNMAHPADMISFIGFDIQNVELSLAHLSRFLKVQDASFYTENLAEIAYLKENGARSFMVRDSLMKLEWIRRAQALEQRVVAKGAAWFSTVKTKEDSVRIAYGMRCAVLVKQYFRMSLNNDEALYRDEAMTDNVSWYLDKINPTAKIVIWAHDVHICRGEHPLSSHNIHTGVSMGSFLAKRYGKGYKSFGIWTNEGTYRAFKTYAYRSLIESPLYKSPKGSVEEAMHQVVKIKQAENLYFSLDRTQAWFNKQLPIRFANHVSFDYGFWPRYAIPYQFDGIFFIDKTSSAKMLK